MIIAALDVPQSKGWPEFEEDGVKKGVPVDVWMRKSGSSGDTLPSFLDIEALVRGGARVVVIPIRLGSGFFGTEGAYGQTLFNELNGKFGAHMGLAALKSATGVVLTDALALDASDVQRHAVVKQVLEEVRMTIPNRPQLQWNGDATARAVDRRTIQSIDVTFAYRPLMTTPAANGIDPAANILAGTKKHPILVTMPFDQGAVTVIGFSPFSFDRWFEDRAHAPLKGTGDGWGLQRLIDPVARMTGNIGTGTSIESLKMSDDHRHLQITCRVPKGDASNRTIGLPQLNATSPGDDVPSVTVMGYDALCGRVEIAVSAPGENPIHGEYVFSWPKGCSGR